MGLIRGEIMRGAEVIINDEGAENNANAKRVELVLDKMLTEGYSTMFGKTAEPNAEYIKEQQEKELMDWFVKLLEDTK